MIVLETVQISLNFDIDFTVKRRSIFKKVAGGGVGGEGKKTHLPVFPM